jgi:hypothetical protein
LHRRQNYCAEQRDTVCAYGRPHTDRHASDDRQSNEGPGDPSGKCRGFFADLGGYPRKREVQTITRMPIRQAVPLMQVAIEIIDPLGQRRDAPSRTIEDRMDILPPGAPKLEEILIDSDAMPWRKSRSKAYRKNAMAEPGNRCLDSA